MLPTSRRWQVADCEPDYSLFPDLHPIVVQVLSNRGLNDPVEVKAFLDGASGLQDPFLLKGMEPAVERLRRALLAHEPIVVYGDFDADGVTATALLTSTLQMLGGQVQPYIPHRVREGYGLNLRALEGMHQAGARVIVTVDCGIRFPREIAYARSHGMDVIVTDHHTVGKEPLEAVAVIDPYQLDCCYPFKHLAGVGLAYKLCQALIRTNCQEPFCPDSVLAEEDLLDLVALGTVADLAPLTNENRFLVARGLDQLNAEPRPGVEALMRQAGLRPGQVDATAIGYALGPRLNAAGRVAHAETAYQLLVARYPAEADRLAQELDNLNRERQQLTAQVQEWAREAISDRDAERPLLFIKDRRFPAGIVGLAASRLMEEFYRPAVVVEMGEEQSRGSARSIPEFHIADALDSCADLLIQHGGHAAAGGFLARTENLSELEERLLALAADEIGDQELTPTLLIDAEVPLHEMAWPLWEAFQQLEPFGEANREPLLASRDVSVRHCRAVGSEGAHLKLLLSDGDVVWDGIAFWQGEWAGQLPDQIDIAYHLQRNEWNGQVRLQLNIQDIRPAGQMG